IGLVALMGALALFFRLMRMRKSVKVVRISDKGIVLIDEISGKPTIIAPQAPATPKPANAASLKPASVKAAVPKLSELLATGFLYPGMPQMLIGVRENITPRMGSLQEEVKCVGVGGRGRSGKTNTMFFYTIQYLFQGAEIWLADPHFNKASGLTTMLGPLRKYIRVAGTLDEIQQMFDDLQVEIEERKSRQGPYRPFVFIGDEWNGILEDFDVEAEQQGLKEKESFSRVAAALIVKIEREMAGYDMYCALGVHDWTDKAIGGTALRRLIHSVLCHRMTADYSKHILEDKAWNSQTQGLRTGHSIFRDNEGIYEKLIMPYCTREDAVTVTRMLETIVESTQPQQDMIAPGEKMPELPMRPQQPQLGPGRVEVDRAQTIDLSTSRPGQTGPLSMSAKEAVTRVNAPALDEDEEEPLEDVKEEDLADSAEAEKIQFTAAEEAELLHAAMQLHQKSGKVPGRVAILKQVRANVQEREGEKAARRWNQKHWPKIAAICSKYGL
ncbi:MAG: hypothetical protein H0U76_19270, partial [Ktedonobacteraceae bacterium]|nr:hypothetical protein [Ktedonobacteraceae bacterium]